MPIQDVVVAVAVVGIVVGLMIVPVFLGIKSLLKRAVVTWLLTRTKRRGKQPLAKQPKKMVVVAAEPISVAPQKRRNRPAISVKTAAVVSVSDIQNPAEGTKKARRGRPSNVEKARRVAEDKKNTDARKEQQRLHTNSVEKVVVGVTKTKKTVDGTKKVRLGRPSNIEKARRVSESAVTVDDRTSGVEELSLGRADVTNVDVHQQLLNMSSEQLFALAVMRETQQSSLQATRTAGDEPIYIG